MLVVSVKLLRALIAHGVGRGTYVPFSHDAKPASTTLTDFGFVQRKDLKSVPLTGYGSPSPFFSS